MSNLMHRFNIRSGWSDQDTEVCKVEVSRSSREFSTVVSLLNGQPKDGLTGVYQIKNPYLYFRYMLRMDEYKKKKIPCSEKLLLHATDASNIESILQDNLDWRRVQRAKFGIGVSFSPSATYANRQCSRSNGRHRAIIVAKVIVGKKMIGSDDQKLPKADYDTTTGNCESVYVKYYDDEFYPDYVIYYDDY